MCTVLISGCQAWLNSWSASWQLLSIIGLTWDTSKTWHFSRASCCTTAKMRRTLSYVLRIWFTITTSQSLSKEFWATFNCESVNLTNTSRITYLICSTILIPLRSKLNISCPIGSSVYSQSVWTSKWRVAFGTIFLSKVKFSLSKPLSRY